MPTTHARVEALEFLRSLWPAAELASGGCPFAVRGFDEAQVLPRTSRQRHGLAKFLFALGAFCQLGIRGENLARAPRAERIVEQEIHHVVFGEQLPDRRQFVLADLVSGGVDLVLPFRLPELVAPAKAIAGGEHL